MTITQHASLEPAPMLGSMVTLAERYQSVKDRIAVAARSAGRRPEDVVLVAVTKFAEPEQIRELIQMGHTDFGENKVQQLLQRAAVLDEWASRQRLNRSVSDSSSRSESKPIRWHMIGHLQRNKVKKAVELCRLIHAVDSLRLAEEIQLAASKREQPMDVLIQVNCSGEESKFGCPMAAAEHIAQQIDTMVSVRVRGLMTMAADLRPASDGGTQEAGASVDDVRATFARCRELFEDIRRTGVGDGQFNILSMGMSHDFEHAIAEGANIVRVGSAIFGEPAAGATADIHEAEED